MLKYKLPFYEKRGSIAEISETKLNYQVYRYTIDGNIETEPNNIKKSLSNKTALLNDFFTNVEEWLVKNKEKYNEILKDNSNQINTNSIFNNQTTKIILILSVIIGIFPLATSFFFNISSLTTIGIASLITGASFATASIIRLDKIEKTEQNLEFIKTFSEYQHELKIYKEENQMTKENTKTKSRSLSPSKRLDSQELPYSFKKILKQDTDKNNLYK